MGIPFVKMSGSGNDFVFIDNRAGSVKGDLSELAKVICARRTGVGADGLVLIEDDPEVDFIWRFLNSDGSWAEMCGNAGRCAARLAHEWGIAGEEVAFKTVAGIIRGKVMGRRVRVQLTTPHNLKQDFGIEVDGREYKADFIDTGVPHTVIFVDDAEAVDVADLGARIRYHEMFGPAGTNVNFAQLDGRDRIIVRTYERGVEAETLACGTGMTAVALIAGLKGLAKAPTTILVRSGEELVIDYAPNPEAEDPWPGPVFFEGVTTKVYEAELGDELGFVWK